MKSLVMRIAMVRIAKNSVIARKMPNVIMKLVSICRISSVEIVKNTYKLIIVSIFFPLCFFSGDCQCLPGWTGKKCGSPCASGFFGLHCGQTCKCQNGGHCRSNDGFCHCEPGWTGTKCYEGMIKS